MSKNDISDSQLSSIETDDVASDTEQNSCSFNDIITNKSDKTPTETPKELRITKNKLTRYELVRILGERTKQLSMGAKPLINVNKESEELEYNEIAIEELKLNMLPFKIKRPTNDSYEIWSLDELKKDHLLSLL